jgi:hypothetical protein
MKLMPCDTFELVVPEPLPQVREKLNKYVGHKVSGVFFHQRKSDHSVAKSRKKPLKFPEQSITEIHLFQF